MGRNKGAIMNCATCDKDDPRKCDICQGHEISESMHRLIDEVKRLKKENEIMKGKLHIIKTVTGVE